MLVLLFGGTAFGQIVDSVNITSPTSLTWFNSSVTVWFNFHCIASGSATFIVGYSTGTDAGASGSVTTTVQGGCSNAGFTGLASGTVGIIVADGIYNAVVKCVSGCPPNTVMDAEIGTVGIDRTNPRITRILYSPPASGFDNEGRPWWNINPTFTIECTDETSGVDFIWPAPTFSPFRPEGRHEEQIYCQDNAGNREYDTIRWGLDQTPPALQVQFNPPLTSFGWSNAASVTVDPLCTDSLSGLVPLNPDPNVGLNPPDPVTFTSEGQHNWSYTCTDVAGNSSQLSGQLGIDRTIPVLQFNQTPTANNFGWNREPVTVNVSCTDTLSGVAPGYPQPASFNFTTEGEHQAIATCQDRAGNTNAGGPTIRIDLTPPDIDLDITPSPNSFGWNNTDVTVTASCTDNLSGVAPGYPDPPSSTHTQEGEYRTPTFSCYDRAGNGAAAGADIRIDKTVPVLEFDQSPLPNEFGWNREPVTVTVNCTDALSGVAPGYPDPSIFSFTTEGEHRAIAACQDRAGNTNTGGPTVRIDMTPPVVNPIIEGEQADGGYLPGVQVRFVGTDNLSGIDFCDPPVTLTEPGAHMVTGTCNDLAGNVGSTTVNVTVVEGQPPQPQGPVVARLTVIVDGENYCNRELPVPADTVIRVEIVDLDEEVFSEGQADFRLYFQYSYREPVAWEPPELQGLGEGAVQEFNGRAEEEGWRTITLEVWLNGEWQPVTSCSYVGQQQEVVQAVDAEITMERGCNATYTVGETIEVTLTIRAIDPFIFGQPVATFRVVEQRLDDPDYEQVLFGPQRLDDNQAQGRVVTFNYTIEAPRGSRLLVLQVFWTNGQWRDIDICNFQVVGGA